jgi:hypothetical protein
MDFHDKNDAEAAFKKKVQDFQSENPSNRQWFLSGQWFLARNSC